MARLARAYGPEHPARPAAERLDPLSELIRTVLSQNTSDQNRDRAWVGLRARFPGLRARLPRWRDVVAAPEADVVDAIRAGGLAATKAPRIQAILREVLAREGRLSLARLGHLSDDDARAYLHSLPGVGDKTAACVLAFSLDRAVLPVDTHVARIAIRLRFADARDAPATIERRLTEVVPPRARLETHRNLIAHGRAICRARTPSCEACPLRDLCPFPAGPSVNRGSE